MVDRIIIKGSILWDILPMIRRKIVDSVLIEFELNERDMT
jgi:hypothetical protein